MLAIIGFGVSIASVAISLFDSLSIVSYLLAILGIIIAIISGYDKDRAEKNGDKTKNSRALEIGAIVISGASIFSYYVFLIISRL